MDRNSDVVLAEPEPESSRGTPAGPTAVSEGPPDGVADGECDHRKVALAVIAGSSCRSEPAAAFLGFAKGGLAVLEAFLVEAEERRLGHVDLTHTSMTAGRESRHQPQGDRRHRPQVGGDVLADLAIAACRALHEQTVLVSQGHCDAVHLQLADVFDLRAGAQQPADPLLESIELLEREGVVEAHHPAACFTGLKPAAGGGPTRRVGESGVTSSGCSFLEVEELAVHLVVLGVADHRAVEDVISIDVLVELFAQSLSLGGSALAHLVLAHRRAPSRECSRADTAASPSICSLPGKG